MARSNSFLLALAGAALVASSGAGARAEDDLGRVLRVIGQSSAGAPIPGRFVIDARLKPGDAPFQSTVEGWFAALPPDTGTGEIEGSCVESRCALSVDLDDGKLGLTGDLGGPATPGPGRASLKAEDDKTPHQGAVTYALVSGPIPDLGELAPPDAVTAQEMEELLMWNGSQGGFSNVDKDWPDSFERGLLADWQAGAGRPATGLILVADLKEMRAGAMAAKAKADWKVLGDPALGWSGGYPASLLTKASQAQGERRFESADGKAKLVLAVDPPLTSEAFDAFWEKVKARAEAGEGQGYTRVNSDFEISWREKDVVVTAVAHSREGGLARLEFSYPADQDETWAPYKTILPRSLRVTDALKPK